MHAKCFVAYFKLKSWTEFLLNLLITFQSRDMFSSGRQVFTNTKKDLGQLPLIIIPSEYTSFFSEHCIRFKLGDEAKVYDWKALAENHLKKPGTWNFKFNEAKSFILSRSAVFTTMENHYTT